MARRYKCPYCDDKYERKDLIEHIDNKHEDLIPENFTSTRIVFNRINKRECGFCRVCNKETKWREDLGRYDILCENPKCKEELRRRYQENMIRVRGTDNILNDPEQQKKMLANRSISGKYKFTDGGVLTFTGSYEKKCLEFMDKVLEIPSKDILSPGPTLEYEMNGEKHFYITDFYLIPQNLIIEVKDGGDNLNTKDTPGMRSSRERTLAKEKLITESGEYNYIRLTNNNFAQLLDVLMEIKEAQFDKRDGKIIKVNESVEIINESSTLMNILVGGILLYGTTQEFIKIKDKLKNKVKAKNKQEIKYIKKEEADKSFEILSDDDYKTLQKEMEEANAILKSVYNSKVKSEYKKYLEFKNGSNNNDGYELKVSRNKYECKYVYCGAAIFMDMSSSKNDDNIDELYNNIIKIAESIVKETNEKINNKKLKFNIKTDFEYNGWDGMLMITSSIKLKPKNKVNESVVNEVFRGTPMKSDLDPNFIPKEKFYLNDFTKKKIDKVFLNKYKSRYKTLKHVDSNNNGYVWMDDDKVVGYCSVDIDKELPWITALEVTEEYKGHGLGEQLLDYAVNELGGQALTVAKDNMIAKRMYDNYGFKASKTSQEKADAGESAALFMYLDPSKSYLVESININETKINSPYLEKGDSCFNLDLWEPNNQNILYIVGMSGSGKTTLGKDVAKEFNCSRVELDNIEGFYLTRCRESGNQQKTYEEVKRECPEAAEFLLDKKRNREWVVNTWGEGAFIAKEFIDWFIPRVQGNGKLYILNGAQITTFLQPEYFADKPIIIKDINMMKSLTRRTIRSIDKYNNVVAAENFLRALKMYFNKNYRKANSDLKKYRKDLSNLVNESYINESSSITLYHGTDNPDFDLILPNSYNVGTHTSKPRMSSYWFDNAEYAKIFATMTVLDNNLPKDPNGRVCLDNDMSILVPNKYKITTINLLKNSNGYVYYRTITNKSIISRGHARYFPEYTIDVPIKPDGIIKVSYKDMINNIKFVDQEYYEEVMHKYATDNIRYDVSIFQQIFDIVTKYSTGDIPKRKRELKKLAKFNSLGESVDSLNESDIEYLNNYIL